MRNLFDQYDQPENRLTHALCSTLSHDRSLVVPFLKWIGIHDIPRLSSLAIAQQTIPGSSLEEAANEKGLPDLCVYDTDGWGVFFEMKVQAKLKSTQLCRHLATAKRHGFCKARVVTVTVEAISIAVPQGSISLQWRDIYSWFAQQTRSFWAREFVAYMEVFEEKAIDKEYELRGALTMFNGLRFDDQHPFHYREAKRLIRLLGDQLQGRADLKECLGIDPNGKRRPAITNDGNGVWDFLPLKVACDHDFTQFPHLTLALRRDLAVAAVTVPNGVAGGFKTKLKDLGEDGFVDLISEVESNLRPVFRRNKKAKAFLYAVQRHFKSQRSNASVDGRIEADLRTSVSTRNSGVKCQPEWVRSIYQLLANKKSNIQCGIEVRFDYSSPRIRSPKAVDLFANSWSAMQPLLDFVLGES